MKPVKLMIRGLNSFTDMQIIDFEKLTDKGLFGIFGPTGSGKSTVLDGITLALYGKNARDSSNYINTQCDVMDVSYSFQIRYEEISHYIIERKFKRNKNNGIETKSARVIQRILDGEDVVVAEGKMNTDKKCKEIIGLSFDDFIRTVVLPQGKFSEFLKLEGKDRRDMLERLFALDQYGSFLSTKLSATIRKEKSEMDKLIGHLKGYETISEESYGIYNTMLSEKQLEEKEQSKAFESFMANFKEQENLWQLGEELVAYNKEALLLENQKATIDDYKLKIKKGENALKVQPYIEALENTTKSQTDTKVVLEEALEQEQVAKKNLEEVNKVYGIIKEKKEVELPKLKILESKVEEAIKEKSQLDTLQEEIKVLTVDYKKLEATKKQYEEVIKGLEEKITTLEESILEGEKSYDTLRVEDAYKEQLQIGLNHILQLENISKRQIEIKKTLEVIGNEKDSLEEKMKALKEEQQIKQQVLEQIEEKNSKLHKNVPEDETYILEMTKNLTKLQLDEELGLDYTKELKALSDKITVYQENYKQGTRDKGVIQAEVKALEEVIKKLEKQNLANRLRMDLKEGEACPVCGSFEHIPYGEGEVTQNGLDDQYNQLQKAQELLNEKEANLMGNKMLLEEITKQQQNLKTSLEKLGTAWQTQDVSGLAATLEIKKIALATFKQEKEKIEKDREETTKLLNEVRLEIGKDESRYTEKLKSYEVNKKEFEMVTEEANIYRAKVEEIKKELQVADLKERSEAIKKMEVKRTQLEKSIKEERDAIKKYSLEKDKLAVEVQTLVGKIAEIVTEGKEKRKQSTEKEQAIKDKVGECTDLSTYKEELIVSIQTIEEDFIKAEKNKEVLEGKLTKFQSDVAAYTLQLKTFTTRKEQEEKVLCKALTEEGFEDTEEVLRYRISKQDIEILKNQVEQYENQLWQLKGKIQEVTSKINGRCLEREVWEKLQEDKNEKEAKLVSLREEIAGLRATLSDMKKRLETLMALLKEKAERDHKLSMLNDLDTLFKGKKFVEFVAMYQLKYVSLEASKKLKEITSGNYGLEIDDSGKFIIRDYKNGGAIRDASTLSGGETFLASLALALALSTQIQLKGNAPLELFFLDEGFGTLDDQLLDIVMGSLEKLHHERFAVGIISHVESIKNRVPVKLIVTPAEAGVAGSLVKIERS